MLKQKTPNDVLGVRKQCINYQMCPICYGCRNYRHDDPDCKNCAKDAKKNLCNTNSHRPELIDRMITKNVISMQDEVTFVSNIKLG
jgi:hypothetical protein